MNAVVRPRSACRICGDPALDRYVDLGNLPLTDQFLGPRDPGPAFLHPVSVWRCRACGVSQTQHDVASVDYLRDYRYTAAQSPFVAAFNRRLARAAFERFGTRPGDTVIEAGSGDGALLACFRDLGCRVLGFEPSAPLSAASRAAGIPVIDSVFDENSPARMEPGTGPVRLAVMTYTFDHLPDPPQSLEAMRRMLDP